MAADAEARERLGSLVAARLGPLKNALASTLQPEPEQKEACFLYVGMLALAASDPVVDIFELEAGMLLVARRASLNAKRMAVCAECFLATFSHDTPCVVSKRSMSAPRTTICK